MIVDEIKRHELSKYNLGGVSPPRDATRALQELNKNLELVWNADDNRWEIYLARGDTLIWQNSAPVSGSLITAGIKTWLQKFDTTKGGQFDQQDLEKRYGESLRLMLSKRAKKEEAHHKELAYQRKDVCDYLGNFFDSHKSPFISVPGPIIGTHNGKPVRLYRKGGTHKWSLPESTQESQILV